MAPPRACEHCASSLEGTHPLRRFCTDTCRKAAKRKPAPAVGEHPPSTEVQDALGQELQRLGVADLYEARIALRLAGQLDDGSQRGAGFVSMSKELDRRVDALRLKAVHPDDPVLAIAAALEEKRAGLRLA